MLSKVKFRIWGHLRSTFKFRVKQATLMHQNDALNLYNLTKKVARASEVTQGHKTKERSNFDLFHYFPWIKIVLKKSLSKKTKNGEKKLKFNPLLVGLRRFGLDDKL